MADTASFDSFYSAAHHRVLRFAYALTGDVGAAQRLAEEAFGAAWQRWERVHGHEDVEAWLRTRIWRSSVRRGPAAGRASRLPRRAPTATVEPADGTAAIVSTLRGLPAAHRRVVVLHHFVGLSVDEVAFEVGAPVGTVSSRLVQSRSAFAPLLADPVPPEPVPPVEAPDV